MFENIKQTLNRMIMTLQESEAKKYAEWKESTKALSDAEKALEAAKQRYLNATAALQQVAITEEKKPEVQKTEEKKTE